MRPGVEQPLPFPGSVAGHGLPPGKEPTTGVALGMENGTSTHSTGPVGVQVGKGPPSGVPSVPGVAHI
jgi:hypothetical protein